MRIQAVTEDKQSKIHWHYMESISILWMRWIFQ